MKKFLLLVASVSLALFSCVPSLGEGAAGNGYVTFATGSAPGGRAPSVNDISAAMVTVTKASDGSLVLNNRRVPMTIWPDGSFTSESVPLDPGSYNLTQFILVDASGKALFAAPVAGSPMAMFVSHPLPIDFAVTPDMTTNVAPEVLDVSNNTPASFGYVTFDFTLVTANCSNIQVTFNNAGADGIWYTADDVIASYLFVTNRVNGQSREITYNAPGSDNKWFTADDVISMYQFRIRDSSNLETLRIEYGAPGPDGTWFTSDDVVNTYRTFTRDANGKVLYEIRHDKGQDGIWFNADDTINHVLAYVYINPELVGRNAYSGPGADNVWFTADDVISDYQYHYYDARGLRVTRDRFTLGADGVQFTSDDVFNLKETFEYSTTKKLILSKRYNPQNTADPADDVLLTYISQINF